MSERASTVVSRVLRLEGEKIDFLLEGYGKIVFYAQEKKDIALGNLVGRLFNEYQEKFEQKTKAYLADIRGFKKESAK